MPRDVHWPPLWSVDVFVFHSCRPLFHEPTLALFTYSIALARIGNHGSTHQRFLSFSIDVKRVTTGADARPLILQSNRCSHRHHPTGYVYRRSKTPSVLFSSSHKNTRGLTRHDKSVTVWHVPSIVCRRLLPRLFPPPHRVSHNIH